METEKRFIGYYEDWELPLKKKQVVTIKKGTKIRSTHPTKKERVAGRTYKVEIHHILNGMTQTVTGEPVHVHNPSIRWVGEGGYWFEVDFNDLPEAVDAPPTVAEAERRTGWKVENWAGNCYAVACQFVKVGLVRGTAVYGHWLGPVAPKSYFGKLGRNTPFVQHGWVLCEDGTILDPTRWGFDGKEPYIHVGLPSKEYDEGGNGLRQALKRPVPDFDPDAKKVEMTKHVLPGPAWSFIEKLLEIDYTNEGQEPGFITVEQLFWLANLPVQDLGPHAPALYAAFEKVGYEAAVPYDNRQMAKRMEKTG